MPYNCSVFGCNATTKNSSFMFHSFPSDPKRKQQWVIKIRSGKNPSKHAKVCGRHFLPDDYRWNAIGDRRILKADASPSENLPKRSHERERSISSLEREARHMKEVERSFPDQILADIGSEVTLSTNAQEENNQLDVSDMHEPITRITESVQTVVSLIRNQLKSISFCTPTQLHYYTGLTPPQFSVIRDLVLMHEDVQESVLSKEDQLFLTLYKLRHNLDYTFMAHEFGVCRQSVRNIFLFFVQLMYQKFKCLNFWDSYEVKQGQYRAIVDCSEIFIERPSNPEHQQITFSSYKNNNTLKFMIGVSEQGLVIFCSEAFGGSISDEKITQLSGFLDLVKEGDCILADKGFEIGTLLEKKKVSLNIPPFRKQGKLSEKDVFLTRAIANRRIIVERVIGLIKTYRIMTDKVPSTLLSVFSQIICICAYLCNFRSPIV